MSNSKELINVYFDYTCPWGRQAGYWLIHLEESDLVEITWKPYLLEQQNSDNDEGWFARDPQWKRPGRELGFTEFDEMAKSLPLFE